MPHLLEAGGEKIYRDKEKSSAMFLGQFFLTLHLHAIFTALAAGMPEYGHNFKPWLNAIK